MIRYLLRRLLLAIPLVVAVVIAVFLLIHLIPGDPIRAMLGDGVPVADVMALRKKFGLDQPLTLQFFHYAKGLCTLDLGLSLHTSQKASRLIAERFAYTSQLAAVGFLITLGLSVPLGMLAALKSRSAIGLGISLASSIGWLLPAFWLAPVLIVIFSVKLRLLPVSGASTTAHLILPAITLAVPATASLTRLIAVRVKEELASEVIRAVRCRGVCERRVMVRHLLPNALAPLASAFALHSGAFLSGAVVTETVFAWPGLGRLLVESIARRDYPVVQGCLLLLSLLYLSVNIAADLVHAALDPRVREKMPC